MICMSQSMTLTIIITNSKVCLYTDQIIIIDIFSSLLSTIEFLRVCLWTDQIFVKTNLIWFNLI